MLLGHDLFDLRLHELDAAGHKIARLPDDVALFILAERQKQKTRLVEVLVRPVHHRHSPFGSGQFAPQMVGHHGACGAAAEDQ